MFRCRLVRRSLEVGEYIPSKPVTLKKSSLTLETELENQYEILQVWGSDLMGVKVVCMSKKAKTVYINIAYYLYNTNLKAVNAHLGGSYME